MISGAWLLNDASYHNMPESDVKTEENPVAENNSAYVDIVQKPVEEFHSYNTQDSYNDEEFVLKSENEYMQLRLSVTSADGKKDEVTEYLKDNLNADVIEDSDKNTVLSSPREEYDSALSAIIDCPHTDNVLYKNEDYYPVACDIYENSVQDGRLPDEAAEYIENIEEMCKSVIIVIN